MWNYKINDTQGLSSNMKISPWKSRADFFFTNHPSSSWYWNGWTTLCFILLSMIMVTELEECYHNYLIKFRNNPSVSYFLFFLVMWILLLFTLNVKICIGFVFFPLFKWTISSSDLLKYDNDIYRSRSRGRVQGVPPPPPEMTYGFLIQLVSCEKKNYVVYWCWRRARDECTPS